MLREYADAGRTAAQIAAFVGCNNDTVARALRRHGIAAHKIRGRCRSCGVAIPSRQVLGELAGLVLLLAARVRRAGAGWLLAGLLPVVGVALVAVAVGGPLGAVCRRPRTGCRRAVHSGSARQFAVVRRRPAES